jgi:hypothetical protein
MLLKPRTIFWIPVFNWKKLEIFYNLSGKFLIAFIDNEKQPLEHQQRNK